MRAILLLFGALSLAAPVAAQKHPGSSRGPGAGGTQFCIALARSYESASMDMADNHARNTGDDSAPLRAMEDANALAKAHITLDLVLAGGCPQPSSAPDPISYSLAATTCRADRLKQTGNESPVSCDRTKWQKNGQ